MSSPLISIIIPVYNAEKYLHQCLDSVVAQTYTNWECLLIDDGSKDSSGAICDEYAEKDSRFRVFHKENGGVSSARNLGLDNAKGFWIMFVDSDDYLEVKYLDEIFDNPKYDLVISGYREFGIKENIIEYDNQEVNIIDNLGTIWNKSISNFIYWFPWGKLFSSTIIKNNNLRFNEFLFYGEDFCFVMDYLNCSNKFYMCKIHGYVHLTEANRYDKYKMNVDQLFFHYEQNEKRLSLLENKCGSSFNKVRANVNMRLIKNHHAYLKQNNNYESFISNIKRSECFVRNMYTVETLTYFSLKKRMIMKFLSKFPTVCYLFRKKIY